MTGRKAMMHSSPPLMRATSPRPVRQLATCSVVFLTMPRMTRARFPVAVTARPPLAALPLSVTTRPLPREPGSTALMAALTGMIFQRVSATAMRSHSQTMPIHACDLCRWTAITTATSVCREAWTYASPIRRKWRRRARICPATLVTTRPGRQSVSCQPT